MSKFRIKTCTLGMVSTNCYLVYDDETGKGVLIDPADRADLLAETCRKLQVTPEAVLLTHGHFDHILAAEELCRMYSCRLYAGIEEEAMLREPSLNLTGSLGGQPQSMQADVWLRDGDVLSLIGCEWRVIATPGHTVGSVCYYIPTEDVLFSGDTLFADSLGRTDLPTGSTSAIIRSIVDRLFVLPSDIMVYPGHGDPTTIGHEKQYNPAAVYQHRHTKEEKQ